MKYHPETVKKIIDNIEIGLNQDDAAAEAGLSEAQFYEWRKSKPEFAEALRQAHLRRKKRNIAIITKAAITKWQAAAWDLERRYRAEFASWYHVAVTGKDGGPIKVENNNTATGLTKKKLEELHEKMDRILRGQKEPQVTSD